MKCFPWVVVLLFAAFTPRVYANSVSTFNITQVTIAFGANIAGDNAFFSLTGPGTSITGVGTALCGWCFIDTPFSPGSSLTPSIKMFFDTLDSITLGGQSYNPGSSSLNTSLIAECCSFRFPTNGRRTFTVRLPAGVFGPFRGEAGNRSSSFPFKLQTPNNGKFVLTFDFSPAQKGYQFSQGRFIEAVVPEPGTLGLVAIGLASLIGLKRRGKDAVVQRWRKGEALILVSWIAI
jgi:hypothetical protein